MEKFIKHFITITKHRHMVIKHSYKCGILLQGLKHDLSKYSFEEFIVGGKFYLGTKSPNEGERKKYGYSKAWMHHKGRNKHHYEYWTDYNLETQCMSAVEMPIKYVVEMFCDRVAASKIYQGKNYNNEHPLIYYLNEKQNRTIHENTANLLEKLFRKLADDGEDKTFEYIKGLKK